MMNAKVWRFGRVLVLAAVVLSSGVGLLVNTKAGGVPIVFATGFGALVASALSLFVERRTRISFSSELESELLQTVIKCEMAGRQYVFVKRRDESDPSVTYTVYSLLPTLVEDGVWSEEDAVRFRKVMHLRNAIVHGRTEEARPHDIEGAVDMGRALTEKITASSTPVSG